MVSESIFYNCELGVVRISATDTHITEIMFVKNVIDADDHTSLTPTLPVLQLCLAQLDDYFEGRLTQFSFAMHQSGTEFQQKVWNELHRIPFGKTISYLELSKKLGNARVIRAAASANGKNSLALVVPCHRVIGSNGSLVGYAGELWRKKWLLNHEARYAHGVQALF